MLPQENMDLEIDPDPQLEREAEETAERVMSGRELGVQRLVNTEAHIQRYPGESLVEKGKEVMSNDSAPEMTDVQGKEAVAAKVDALAENQQKLFSAVEASGQSTAEKVGVETGKGTLAATGGIAGTALMGPGVGTLVGGLAGGAVGGVYERVFDDGAQAMTNVAESTGDLFSAIDQRVRDAVEQYLGDYTGSGLEGVGKSGEVNK